VRRPRGDGGQAAVELALVLPFVCLVLLALVQIGLVVHAQLIVTHAAREGVRAAAVDPHPNAAAMAVIASSTLDPGRLGVDVSPHGDGRVRVEVDYTVTTDVPLVGALLGDVDLSAAAVMRVEHEGSG
jgi:Flp pilus assembly protein TadG